MENSGLFPEEEAPPDAIVGVSGRGEGGSEPSGVVDGSGTS